MNQFDSPWKDALDSDLPAFLQLCLPAAHAEIDWTRGFAPLNAELRKIARDAEVGNRTVDRFYRVSLKGGQRRILHLHIEIQSQHDAGLPERMFVYYYRIYDLKAGPVMSVVVFGDDSPTWRPDRYAAECLGCEATLKYNTVKLLDFRDRIDELEASDNPIAPFIVAHLKALATTEDDPERRAWKFRLIRGLYGRGLKREEILRRFRLIEWVMKLNEPLEAQFQNELIRYERRYAVPYITAIERSGIEKGHKRGHKLGHKQGREEGKLIARIQMLQEQLGVAVQADSDLEAMTLDQLRECEAPLARMRAGATAAVPGARAQKK